VSDKDYVRECFAARTEVAIRNLEALAAHLGDTIDVIGLEGNDFGAQNTELLSPGLFEELFVPFFREQNDWVHAHTSWKTWYHCCGSITRILPLLIDCGVDVINPVQTSAAGMDPCWLKRSFGKKVAFWGGGVDTQRTLPFGSPETVAAEVRERLRILAPGGGFVFNPIHNIQQGTPPANIVSAYDTARTAGVYPVRG
jgi:uroporphyrinogen-III decarboxylase